MLILPLRHIGIIIGFTISAAATAVLANEEDLSAYAFNAEQIDTRQHYLFYFHGRIIEDQGLSAYSQQYGHYDYLSILHRLKDQGFTVISEQRPPHSDAEHYAQRVQQQIDQLLKAGVAATQITVAGASKGAYIASLVSHYSRNTELRFVLLAGCNPQTVQYMVQQQIDLYGHILAIRDISDTALAGSCADVFKQSDGVTLQHEIVTQLQLSHGLIYRPYDEWVQPLVNWALH